MTGSQKQICHMNAFSSRCRADINHSIPRFWICCKSHQHGAYILHLKIPLFKAFQKSQGIIIGNFQCIFYVSCFFHMNPFFFKKFCTFFRGNYAAIHTNGGCSHIFIKGYKHIFPMFHTVFFDDFFYQPLRHGISCRKCFHRLFLLIRHYNLILPAGKITKHTVNKSF